VEIEDEILRVVNVGSGLRWTTRFTLGQVLYLFRKPSGLQVDLRARASSVTET
jgi:hypothetical protein